MKATEAEKEAKKRYYYAHREKVLEKARKYREQNSEAVKAKLREIYRRKKAEAIANGSYVPKKRGIPRKNPEVKVLVPIEASGSLEGATFILRVMQGRKQISRYELTDKAKIARIKKQWGSDYEFQITAVR